MKNAKPTNIRKQILSVFLAFTFIFGINFSSKACSPLSVPILVSQTIVGSNLLLQWNSVTPYKCPDVIDVEIACNSATYSGLAAYTYTSSVVTGVGATYSYPTMTINIAALCPGTTYKFRARERNNGSMTSSLWTANFTFLTPGVFTPPTGGLTATPPVITLCPQGTSVLTMTCLNCCGGGPYTYTWLPSGSNAVGISSLTPGAYTLIIKDSKACTTSQPFNITQPAILAYTTAHTDEFCVNADGTATVFMLGGTAPYTYSWSTVSAQTTATVTGNICFGNDLSDKTT